MREKRIKYEASRDGGKCAFAPGEIYSVSEANNIVKELLEDTIPEIMIEGEISNFKAHSSGHHYFTLKDRESELRAIMLKYHNLKLSFKPENGLKVIATGRITIYHPRGLYQINVKRLEPVGIGSLQLAFEQLKKRLREEGLFDEEKKKNLPLLPEKIGIITSPTGAALRDILRVIKRRYANVELLIYPSLVQGEKAATQIAEGIKSLDTKGLDVLIVGRGGGSMEDLWPFNEEIVARAIFSCRTPIISAIGHDIDYTIADFAADVRAATPSQAAEIVVVMREELERRISDAIRSLIDRTRLIIARNRNSVENLTKSRGLEMFRSKLEHLVLRVDELTSLMARATQSKILLHRKGLSSLETRLSTRNLKRNLAARRYEVGNLTSLLEMHASNIVSAQKAKWALAAGNLNAVSPLSVLARGYSICTRLRDGVLVRRAEEVEIGEDVKVTLDKGALFCEVREREERREEQRKTERNNDE